MRSAKLFTLLALFMVGSVLSVMLTVSRPQPTYAVTAAQKKICLDNFGTTPVALTEPSATKLGAKTEKGILWDTNKCGEEKDGKYFCKSEPKSVNISIPSSPMPVVYTQIMSAQCDRSWKAFKDDGTPDESDTTDDDETVTSSCNIDNMGWILCSMGRIVADTIEVMFQWLTDFLILPMISTNTDTKTNRLYATWATARNLANGLLILVFLLIIYSQIMGGRK